MLMRKKKKKRKVKGKRINHSLKYFTVQAKKAPGCRRLFLSGICDTERIKHELNRIKVVIWFNFQQISQQTARR